MEIKRGEITLKKITDGDIELIRRWRNSAEVSRYMEYREHITKQMQERWFRKIDNDNNLYFLIIAGKKPLGLIYGAEINWQESRVGNAGIFIGEEKYREHNYALEASVLLNDFAFSIGIESIYIKILSDNDKAIAYNKLLGYCLLENKESTLSRNFFLNKASYLASRKKLSRIIKETGPFELIYQDDTDKEIVSRIRNYTGADGLGMAVIHRK